MSSLTTSELPPPLAHADRFPATAADEDCAVQTQIAIDIENAQGIQMAFETDPQHSSTIWQMRHRPTQNKLYPNLMAAEARGWLMPLIRRLRWNAARPELPWVKILSDMIVQALRIAKPVTKQELTFLLDALSSMDRISRLLCLTHLPELLEGVEREGAASNELIRGIRGAREEHQANFANGALGDPFLWPLFRLNGIRTTEAPWATQVRADIGKSDVGLLAIFNAANGAFENSRPTKRALAAVEELGNGRVEAGLQRWVGMLRDAPLLSKIDTTILGHLILLVDNLPVSAAEELLWEIARTPGRWKEEGGWVKAYLWAINRYVAAGRSPIRAFTCVEALAMNQATAMAEVLETYHSLLSKLQAEESQKGVDGFPFDGDAAVASVQRRIDDVLRICAEAVADGPYLHPQVAALGQLIEGMKPEEKSAPVKVWHAQMVRPRPYWEAGPDAKEALNALEARIFKEVLPLDLFYSTFQRADWITDHEAEFSQELLKAWRQRLQGSNGAGGMRRWALNQLDSLPLPWLVRTLRSVPGDLHTIDLCRRHVAEHGWNAELVEAMRAWVKALETYASVNLDRARVEWFLWFEDVCPVIVDDCWSYRLKQDLRQMKPKQRAAWIDLLDNPSFTVTAKPPQKWLKSARAAFPRVGAEEFRRGFVEWFKPFGDGTPLRLTVCGRNVLRGLMWVALVAADPVVDEALCRFAGARWKTKEHLRRAAQAEMAFAHVLAERAPEGAVTILEGMLASGRAKAGSFTEKALQALRLSSRT